MMRDHFGLWGLLLASTAAHAAAGIAMGHTEWAEDGMPNVREGEQVLVFHCAVPGNTREAAQKAQDCALAACTRKFNSAKLCRSDDFSTHPGFTVVYVGTKGDNQYLYSAGYSRHSRAEAVREASQNKFPVDSATLALDFFESDGRVVHNRKHDPGFKGR